MRNPYDRFGVVGVLQNGDSIGPVLIVESKRLGTRAGHQRKQTLL